MRLCAAPRPMPADYAAGPASLPAQARRFSATCCRKTCGPTQRRRQSCSGACTCCWARAASGERQRAPQGQAVAEPPGRWWPTTVDPTSPGSPALTAAPHCPPPLVPPWQGRRPLDGAVPQVVLWRPRPPLADAAVPRVRLRTAAAGASAGCGGMRRHSRVGLPIEPTD